MRVFEFPKDEVKQGSKVVIYGGGDVGRQYVSWLKAKKYVELLFVVDAQALPLGGLMHGVRTVYASWFFENCKKIDFDYILIAVFDEKERNGISNDLKANGVDEAKIVSSITYYDSVSYIRDERLRPWYRPSFSWYGEDVIVKGLFRMMGIDNPSYIDIGCNLPYEGNNTALLYLTGSRGINIDASQKCIDIMKIERSDDLNICAGVDIDSGERSFYVLDETCALNSFSKEYMDQYFASQHIAGGAENNKRTVYCYTLSDIIGRYCNGEFPDYLDLDIEGLDSEVIKNYNFADVRPKVICVESHDVEMNNYLDKSGYKLYYSTPHNEIFIDRNLMTW